MILKDLFNKFHDHIKAKKPISNIGFDKVHSKRDCIYGSIVNGIRELFLYSFALDKPPGHKVFKEPRIKLFKKINKAVLSHLTFYLRDDFDKPVDFNGEKISFTCQLIKIRTLLCLKERKYVSTQN